MLGMLLIDCVIMVLLLRWLWMLCLIRWFSDLLGCSLNLLVFLCGYICMFLLFLRFCSSVCCKLGLE